MHVMILEDDTWIAGLLRQIVHSLRPQAQIICKTSVDAALEEWQINPADLVICDWNLPDGPGTRLLERIRQQDAQVPLVMITGRADRDSVLQVRSLRVSAFITKPFHVPKVLDCLDRLLPAGSSLSLAVAPAVGLFTNFLAEQTSENLDMPLQAGSFARLVALGRQPAELRSLYEIAREEPAITARLLAAANSAQYSNGGSACMSLHEALQALGAGTSLNIALGLTLRAEAELRDPELILMAQEHFGQTQSLCKRVADLAVACGVDPAPLHSAALLHRMGELCVLEQAQRWRDKGYNLSMEDLAHALSCSSSEFAGRLKAHWRLPIVLRDLIGACYTLPAINTRREAILMHLAAAELNGQADPTKLARLRRLVGLS